MEVVAIPRNEPIQEPSFDPARHDIRHVLDIGLDARRDVLGAPKARGFRASSLGYCLRRQLLERAGVPVPPGGGDRGLRTLWLGDLIHGGFQRMMRDSGLLIAEELTLEDPDTDMTGHVDMVWGGKVADLDPDLHERVSTFTLDFISAFRDELRDRYGDWFPITLAELKSAAQYGAEKAYTDGPSFHHVIQAGWYRGAAEKYPGNLPDVVIEGGGGIQRFQLVMIAKNDLKMPVFDILPSHAQRAMERAEELTALWDDEEARLPPCTCGIDLSWEPRYCRYRDPNSPDRNPACCGDHLTDEYQELRKLEVLAEKGSA